ncbi:hypothetical protein [Neorhizobium galegae]|uniref:hypothetical protein n=1 Tax=Neorhizobium galegae TaxID=399 RepID=UPI00062804B2|nr:hypothetical protein [Neorhizobium galegae]MCQ1810868.1 hypothetical protein [Neorhizobium galegae]MCQ1838068.1 hypothetical protein [Neorhizobium galegae]
MAFRDMDVSLSIGAIVSALILARALIVFHVCAWHRRDPRGAIAIIDVQNIVQALFNRKRQAEAVQAA